MVRSVVDVAIVLTAMAGSDANDSVTGEAAELDGTDFTQFLTTEGVDTLRVGYFYADETLIRGQAGDAVEVTQEQIDMQINIYDQIFGISPDTIARLEAAGVELVRIPIEPSMISPTRPAVSDYLAPSFKYDLNNFLAGLGDMTPYATLEEIVAANNEDLSNRAPYRSGLYRVFARIRHD